MIETEVAQAGRTEKAKAVPCRRQKLYPNLSRDLETRFPQNIPSPVSGLIPCTGLVASYARLVCFLRLCASRPLPDSSPLQRPAEHPQLLAYRISAGGWPQPSAASDFGGGDEESFQMSANAVLAVK